MYSSHNLYAPLCTESRCFSAHLVNSLLPYPPRQRSLLARQCGQPSQLLANSGSYRINSLVYIYPDTVQLCHRLNTLCSPEFNMIHETCLELSKAIVTSGLSSALWRSVEAAKMFKARKERAAKGHREEGGKSWAMMVHGHHTQSLGSCVFVFSGGVCSGSAGKSVRRPLKVKDQNGDVASRLCHLYLGLSPSPTSMSTPTVLKWLTSYCSEHILLSKVLSSVQMIS